MEEISIYEYIWRNCYQIVAWKNGKSADKFPDIFGSGFLFEIDGKIYIITAGHVANNKDFAEGYRTSIKYDYAIVSNEKSDSGIRLASVSCLSKTDEYDFGDFENGKMDLDVALIPNMKDISICEINKQSLSNISLVTHEFDLGTIVVKDGLKKLVMKECQIEKPSGDNKYLVMGCVMPITKDAKHISRTNIVHQNLTFEREENGTYIFKSPDEIEPKMWEGLSGSPFFSENGGLIGMLTSINKEECCVMVMPMCQVVKYIKYYDKAKTLQMEIK